MPSDEPITWVDGALSEADLNTLRNLLRWLGGFEPGNDPGSKPFARVRSTTPISLPDSPDWNLLSFDTVVFDEGEASFFNSPSEFVAPVSGYYLCGACARTEPTTANKALRIIKNGTTEVEHDNIGVTWAAYTQFNVMTLVYLEVGDGLEAQVYQDSGGAISVVVDGNTPNFWVAWYAYAPTLL